MNATNSTRNLARAASVAPFRLVAARNAADGFAYDGDALARAASAPAGIVGRYGVTGR